MKNSLSLWMETFKTRFEAFLNEVSDQADPEDQLLWDAMRYSLLAGGKRLRPAFLVLCGCAFGEDEDTLMPYAAALEMIHTYSLIHDDLPAMDNDDYRRGRLTNHKVYGEAPAILAGDGLLNEAAVIMSQDLIDRIQSGENAEAAALAMHEILKASGPKGMIAGQIADIAEIPSDEARLCYINEHKTSALLMASLVSGGYLGGASEEAILALRRAGSALGQAFQIQDDILDVEGSIEKLGKRPGSDALNNKTTYVTLYGMDESKQRVKTLTDQALFDLQVLPGTSGERARELAASLMNRSN